MPRLIGRLFTAGFITLAVLIGGPVRLCAQDENGSDLDRVKEVEDNLYPSFVDTKGEDPSPTPTPGAEPDRTQQAEPGQRSPEAPTASPTPVPELLVTDLASTQTWTQVRNRLEPDLEELRSLMISRAEKKPLFEQYDRVIQNFDLIIRMAPYQAPLQEKGLRLYRGRITKQVDYLLEDYLQERWRQFENTDELLRDATEEFQYLLFQSDLDRGAAERGFYDLPENWTPPSIPDERFSEEIAAWSTDKIVSAYRRRWGDLQYSVEEKRDFKRRRRQALEMGMLARELATRIYDVPVESRTGFQNAALQMDVQAQNLADYLQTENRPYALQQLRAIDNTLERTEIFLSFSQTND